MKRSALDWRLLSSAALFVISALLIWPTIDWYSMPETQRDRAEASVQPETDNPHFVALLEEMRAEGGEETLSDYREIYERSRGTIKLGLDLQGGMYLSYIIEPVGGLEPSEAIEQALETIRNRVDEFGVSEPSITRQGQDRMVVQLPGIRDPARARSIVERQALLEFKIVAYPNARVSIPSEVPALAEIDALLAAEAAPAVDSAATVPGQVDGDVPASDTTIQPAADSISGTQPEEGFSLPETQPADQAAALPSDSLLSIPEMPAVSGGSFTGLIQGADEYSALSLSISPGDWMIESGEDYDLFMSYVTRADVDSILAARNLLLVTGRETETQSGTFRSLFLVPRDATRGFDQNTGLVREYYALTGASLTDAYIRMGDDQSLSSAPYLILEFDSEGAANWERITGENVEERVSVILDGTMYSVATIRERISGTSTRLSGGFSVEEARDLRLVLKAGSLPARLILAEEQTIGPSMGRQALDRGLIAALAGFAIVALFMIVYYGTGGVIATVGLVLNMLLILATLCFPGPLARLGVSGLGATLTLPGIAGIVLTIGMAVDANVLIFERIREERRSGKSIRPAVEAGFARAFTTILDSNLTTLITALILYRFGTGPVRGFAVTLSIGILASLFCSLVFGRGVFELLLRKKSRTDIGLGRLHFFLGSKIGFVKIRKTAYVISLALILAGVAAFALNGGFRMSIDFTGGLETNVTGPEGMTVEQLRTSLFGAGLEGVQVQQLEDYEGEGNAFVIRTSTMDSEEVNAALVANGCSPMGSEEEGTAYIRQIGPRVGSELRSKATSAVLLSWVAIILYVWYRFQLKWGFASVLALVHDTLITLGFLAFARIEISLTIIAAILTIIGYSINDTIVVFDRIRENRRLRKGRTFEETVDMSVNETLSRTIITSLTTFLAVLALFIFGVGEIADFALTMCLGLVVGTYSSVFVAGMLLVDWKGRRERAQ
ncbi:MAG: protein translocase subunit SecD [Candidatus Fermentibacter sp.]|nr:protein translocase subunit SecD [Candidatus Fermentibacter sp.]